MRPTWDEYFIQMAGIASSRSTCFRNRVGAVIVINNSVIATGYNGAPMHQKNCQEMGFCYRLENKIESGTQLERCRAVGSHAESNAISLAARNGFATNGATIYVTGHNFICPQCKALIANAGIERVVLRRKEDGKFLEFCPRVDWTVHPIDKEELK